MSKHQKGRRHRTVNRNPRPAGPARPPAAPRTPAVSGPAGRAVPDDEQSRTRTRETSPQTPKTPPAPAQPVTPDAPRTSDPVPDGGLGHHAARTWQEVRSAGDDGITVDELCTAVGYQSRTILKHLKALAQDGLAEPHGERWRPTGQKLL